MKADNGLCKTNSFSMSAQTIHGYPWKLFQMTALKLPRKPFLPPFGAGLVRPALKIVSKGPEHDKLTNHNIYQQDRHASSEN